MANDVMVAEKQAAPGRRVRYAGWVGSVIGSALYRMTIGALAENRRARLIILLAVPLAWILFFNIGPILQMVNISLLANYPLQEGDKAIYTLAQYKLFFQEKLYFVPFIRSLIFSLLVTLATLIIVYPVAYYIGKIVRPGSRNKALLLLLTPFWAGEIIRTFSVIMLLANRGAVNALLRGLGLIDRPIPMLYTYFSLSFGVIYLIALYMLLPLYSSIEKIPNNLIDAASDLGAGPVQRFRRVILPLSRDGIISGCSLVFLTAIGVFSAPLLLGGPGTVIFPELIAQLFHSSNDKWPAGAAFSIIMLVISLSTVGLFMRVAGGKNVKLM